MTTVRVSVITRVHIPSNDGWMATAYTLPTAEEDASDATTVAPAISEPVTAVNDKWMEPATLPPSSGTTKPPESRSVTFAVTTPPMVRIEGEVRTAEQKDVFGGPTIVLRVMKEGGRDKSVNEEVRGRPRPARAGCEAISCSPVVPFALTGDAVEFSSKRHTLNPTLTLTD